MGKLFVKYLDGRVYSCKCCSTNLAHYECVLSKQFHCRTGRAFLFNHVTNVCLGTFEDRMMTTGKHTVCDIYCSNCLTIVGWKYERAYEQSQKYKEGKFILERAVICDSRESVDDDDHHHHRHHHHNNENTIAAFYRENSNPIPVNLNPELPSGLVQAMNSISRPMAFTLGGRRGGGSSGSDDLSMRTFRQLSSSIVARAQNSIEESENTPISFRSDD